MESIGIPGAPSGSIVIRATDTHQSTGDRNKSTLHVDHLYIQVGNPPSDPPDGDPNGMTVAMVSSSEIELAWMDGTSNETGFSLERSTDEISWTEIADLPLNSVDYSNSGLTANTQYFYRVSAYNINGRSEYTAANATTDATPPPPPPAELSLTASGYKDKGKHHVNLEWTGSDNVDIYRDGAYQATIGTETTYDDNIGAKGGASYQHQVCEAGTDTCSNVTNTVF